MIYLGDFPELKPIFIMLLVSFILAFFLEILSFFGVIELCNSNCCNCCCEVCQK